MAGRLCPPAFHGQEGGGIDVTTGRFARVAAIASALPDRVVPNAYFETILDTSDLERPTLISQWNPYPPQSGFAHTAVMYSRNIEHMHAMARTINTSIFVKNASNLAGLGDGGEGYTSFTIASPTGEGLTTAGDAGRIKLVAARSSEIAQDHRQVIDIGVAVA